MHVCWFSNWLAGWLTGCQQKYLYDRTPTIRFVPQLTTFCDSAKHAAPKTELRPTSHTDRERIAPTHRDSGAIIPYSTCTSTHHDAIAQSQLNPSADASHYHTAPNAWACIIPTAPSLTRTCQKPLGATKQGALEARAWRGRQTPTYRHRQERLELASALSPKSSDQTSCQLNSLGPRVSVREPHKVAAAAWSA